MPRANFADLPCLGRLSGDELVAWLCEQLDLRGWWLCYNADDVLLARYPASCLAHHLGVSVGDAARVMSESGLVGKGKKVSSRAALLDGLEMHTARLTMGYSKFNFLCLGAAVDDSTLKTQLEGDAPRAAPKSIVGIGHRRMATLPRHTSPPPPHPPSRPLPMAWPASILSQHPPSCLAHHLGIEPDKTAAAMVASDHALGWTSKGRSRLPRQLTIMWWARGQSLRPPLPPQVPYSPPPWARSIATSTFRFSGCATASPTLGSTSFVHVCLCRSYPPTAGSTPCCLRCVSRRVADSIPAPPIPVAGRPPASHLRCRLRPARSVGDGGRRAQPVVAYGARGPPDWPLSGL